MKYKIKILFFIHQLNAGGSQKVILNIVSNLNKENYNVVLVVINKIGEFSDFHDENVKVIDLKTKNIRNSILKIINVINTEKADIVFSGLSFLSLIFSFLIPFFKFQRAIKFIARETNTLSISNATQKYPKLRNKLYKLLYKRFDLIICQSQLMMEDLIINYNIQESKMIVINNPVDIPKINTLLSSDSTEKLYNSNYVNLLAVGRLHYNKGFDILLEVISKLDSNYHLTILGEGKEEEKLKELAKALNILDRVHFLGFKLDPYIYMKQADLFLLSSRHEGFPNVVLEANSCRTPVVAFNCPGVSKEIISDGVNGFLAECGDVNDMKNKILIASDYSWEYENIKKFVYDRFRSEKILSNYESAFINVYNKSEKIYE